MRTDNDLLAQRVKDTVLINEFAGRYTELRPAGRWRLRGHCPLHEDPQPSFTVYLDSGRWWCFGCTQGGDVITLAMKMERKGYVQALIWLAQQYGIPIPKKTKNQKSERSILNPLYDPRREALALDRLQGRTLLAGVYLWLRVMDELYNQLQRQLAGCLPLEREANDYTRLLQNEQRVADMWGWMARTRFYRKL